MAKKNTDTVSAMLTPGEFVIKKKSAKKIGYNRLNKINKTGKIVSKNKKSKERKMAKTKKKYQLGGIVSPLKKALLNSEEPSGVDVMRGRGRGGVRDDIVGIDPRDRDMVGLEQGGRGRLGFKKGGKVKATGGYKVVGQRKGYKVGE
jgi:hypothetical protein